MVSDDEEMTTSRRIALAIDALIVARFAAYDRHGSMHEVGLAVNALDEAIEAALSKLSSLSMAADPDEKILTDTNDEDEERILARRGRRGRMAQATEDGDEPDSRPSHPDYDADSA